MSTRRGLTIGARLAILNGVVFGGMAIAIGMLGLVAVYQALLESADDVLLEELNEIGVDLSSGPHPAEEIVRKLSAETNVDAPYYVVFYRVHALDGRRIADTPGAPWPAIPFEQAPPQAPGALPPRRNVRVPGEEFRLRVASARFRVAPHGPVQIDAALRLKPEDLALAELARRALVAGPAAVAAAVLVGVLLSRRALRPIGAIDAAARTIGGGPPGKRLPRTGNGDELDRLAETLNAMLERLEAAAARNLRFAGDVAHEVRTPLATIRTRLEAARDASDEAGRAPIGIALEEVSRVEALARNLLLLSRADEGGVALARAPLDLARVAREAADFFAPLAEEKGVVFRPEIAASAPVLGDAASLHHVVANLVDNAIYYADPGDSVSLRVTAGADGVVLDVEDTGAGVPEALQPRMFERFFRAPDPRTRARDGSGLGLALVRAVARAHGGEASYEPRAPRGSRFRVRLPGDPRNGVSPP